MGSVASCPRDKGTLKALIDPDKPVLTKKRPAPEKGTYTEANITGYFCESCGRVYGSIENGVGTDPQGRIDERDDVARMKAELEHKIEQYESREKRLLEAVEDNNSAIARAVRKVLEEDLAGYVPTINPDDDEAIAKSDRQAVRVAGGALLGGDDIEDQIED